MSPRVAPHFRSPAAAPPVSVGGNYVRNTMSSRDEGNVWPFDRHGERYDLDRWDDEYWRRFEKLLRLTHERGIVVQIELWDFWDFFLAWETGPWNPANNVNYTTANTQLSPEPYPPPRYRDGETYGEPHGFFLTVPEARYDAVVLEYQQRFIDKLLDHASSRPALHLSRSAGWGAQGRVRFHSRQRIPGRLAFFPRTLQECASRREAAPSGGSRTGGCGPAGRGRAAVSRA